MERARVSGGNQKASPPSFRSLRPIPIELSFLLRTTEIGSSSMENCDIRVNDIYFRHIGTGGNKLFDSLFDHPQA